MVTVLYVENVVGDNQLTVQSTIKILESGGHKVIVASNGKEGLESLLAAEDTENIGVIITNYNMPVMGGYKFSEAVRNDPAYSKYKGIPIIGIEDFPDGMGEYINAFMPKPYPPQELLGKIDQLVNNSLLPIFS